MGFSLLKVVPAVLLLFALPPVAAEAQTTLPSTTDSAASEELSDEPYVPETEYDEYMRLGFDAQQREDYRSAAAYFRAALYANPGDREAITAYWNARGAMQAGEDTVSGAYEQAMNRGYDATEVGDYEAALGHFRTALQQRPDDYYAAQAIRNVYTYLNRGERADSPDDVAPTYSVYAGELPYDRYMRLGYAAAQREDFAAAQRYFRGALYERPRDRQATIAYWNAVDGSRDGEFGLESSEPETAYDRYMRLGYDATEREDYTAALSFFEQALSERPEDGYAIQAIRNVQTYME
ncbi:MAG: hypothetical protein F6J97_14270 [Leptolyngbya sp. SIO4C1]|nr:hypothetical protein [Leptolyngbya sp. SIO4C1]